MGDMSVVPVEVPEDEWVARCRKGEIGTPSGPFTTSISRKFSALRGCWELLLRSSKSLTQEVFSLAFSKLDRFQGGNFGHWLHRICANVVNDRHRKRRVRDAFRSLFGG